MQTDDSKHAVRPDMTIYIYIYFLLRNIHFDTSRRISSEFFSFWPCSHPRSSFSVPGADNAAIRLELGENDARPGSDRSEIKAMGI